MSKPLQEDPFFQFPLTLLAFDGGAKLLADVAVDYAVVNCGVARVRSLSATEHGMWKKVLKQEIKARDFDLQSPLHLEAAAGCKVLGVTFPSFDVAIRAYQSIKQRRDEFAQRHGPSPDVRLRSDIIWSILLDDGLDDRQFRVLCAYYSAIGNNQKPVRVTREAILPRFFGYKSKKVMEAELPSRSDNGTTVEVPTIKQIRTVTDQLCARSLLFRFNPSRRSAYYSHRMSTQEMAEWFKQRAPKVARFIAKERRLRNEFNALMEAEWQKATTTTNGGQ